MAPQFLSPIINTSIKETMLVAKYSNDKSISNHVLRNSFYQILVNYFHQSRTFSLIDQSEKKLILITLNIPVI